MTDTPVPPRDTGTQFAGLTEAERAIAAVQGHMSTCDAPTIDECGECRVRLAVIRRDLAAVTPIIRRQVAEEIAETIRAHDERYGGRATRYAIGFSDALKTAAAIARSHSTQPTEGDDQWLTCAGPPS